MSISRAEVTAFLDEFVNVGRDNGVAAWVVGRIGENPIFLVGQGTPDVQKVSTECDRFLLLPDVERYYDLELDTDKLNTLISNFSKA